MWVDSPTSATMTLGVTKRRGIFKISILTHFSLSQVAETAENCQKCLARQKTDTEKASSDLSHKKYLESEVQRLRKKVKVNEWKLIFMLAQSLVLIILIRICLKNVLNFFHHPHKLSLFLISKDYMFLLSLFSFSPSIPVHWLGSLLFPADFACSLSWSFILWPTH